MKFCSHCGAGVQWRIPDGDNLPRHICDSCNTIHYQNPKIVAGCIPEWEDKILLCKRAIEPKYGLWTLPAGFMENNETTAEAALRETQEEANAQVDSLRLYAMFDIAYISQVYLMFRARMVNQQFKPGQESLDVALYKEDEIPWNELAFPVIDETLRRYFKDKKNNAFGLHIGEIQRKL